MLHVEKMTFIAAKLPMFGITIEDARQLTAAKNDLNGKGPLTNENANSGYSANM